MRRGLATATLAAVVAATIVADVARAETDGIGLGTLLLLPSEVGSDVGRVGGNVVSRFRVGWSYQLPACSSRSSLPFPLVIVDVFDALDVLERCPHLVVVSGRLAFGAQTDPESGREAAATFDARGGYRYRFADGDHTAPYVGMGNSIDFWPRVRPSISPEIGVRFRGRPVPYLGLQGDLFLAAHPYGRVMLLAGWSIF